MRLAPGTTVGPYVIEAPLGRGGMGEVYRARDPRLSRPVAIKVLAGLGAPDSDALRRFELEARAAAALSHPNILTIHDVGTHEGLPFLVMELLEGETLRQRLARGPLPAETGIALGLALARGATAAHAVRIVHRDLKPDNVFVTAAGGLKILDFGVAKLRPVPLASADASTVADSLPGMVFGTLAYMAPEQLRGDPVDARADLFSIGAVLYEMLAGDCPFRRPSAAATIAAVLHEPPTPLATTGPPALESVIRRCLEKDPSERYTSAAELVAALEALQATGRPASVGTPTAAAPQSIAVLPFADMSQTRDQDYLCEGLAEELLNSLTRIAGLRIAARSSSFQFRGEIADVRAVGERLGVAAVVEGSVRKSGDRLRINVRLVDVADGYQRWSERYDRKLEDVFAIQDEIAESVVTALRGVLSRKEREALQRPGTTAEVYEYFLRGRQLLNRFSRPSMEGARQMFERAVALDPGYAPAWSGIADTHSWAYQWWGGSKEDIDHADRASRKALELGPGLAETHASRGFALELGSRYEEAALEFERALAIDPRHFDSLYLYARSSFAHGDVERSVELFRRAAEARTEDFQSVILLSQSLRVLGRTDEAREANREAVRRVEKALELNPTDSRALSLGAHAIDDDGQHERARRWTERAIDLYPNEQSALINGACLHAKNGRKEEALAILELVFNRGWGKRDWIDHDPDYDGLRDDPRFQALLTKLR